MKRDNLYTLFFAAVICVLSSSLLTLVHQGLKEKKDANVLAYQRKNILLAFGKDAHEIRSMSNDAVNRFFSEAVREQVIRTDGTPVPDRTPASLRPDHPDDRDLLVIYQLDEMEKAVGYAFPIVGKGLWSTLYGYFALEPDLNTVRGITFYQHGETPGLGGEIEAPWFQGNFPGKKILDNEGNLVSITIVKGQVADRIRDPEKQSHYVDGISGATITSRGVTQMLQETLKKYEPYFSSIRGRS